MPIAVFYFFFIGSLGILAPYLSPYLKSLGLDMKQVSRITALGPLLMIFAPPLWGLIADRTGKPALILKIACFSAAAVLFFMLSAHSFAAVAIVFFIYSIFWSAIGGLADTVAVAEAKRLNTDFARLRVWGSIGFILATYLFGVYLSRGGKIESTVPAYFAMMVLCSFLSLIVKSAATPGMLVPSPADALRLASDPALLLFLLSAMIHWAASASYFVCFAVHLEDLAIDPKYVGIGFSAGVIAEVGVMWTFRHFSKRLPILGLIGVVFFVTSLRWYLTSIVTSGPGLAAIQSLHGLTFGLVFVGAVVHLERTVPENLRASGRALFSSIVMGCGGIAGNIIAGIAYERGKGPGAFQTAAALELLAPVFLLLSIRVLKRKHAGTDSGEKTALLESGS